MTFIGTRSKFKVIFAAALLFLCCRFASAAENNSSIDGVVRDASGKPVTGAFVKMKNNDRHFELMVISQEEGRYTASNLPAGSYVVQGVGGGYQSQISAPINLAEGKTAKLDLSLSDKQGTMLPRAWPMRTPEVIPVTLLNPSPSSLPDGDGKEIVAGRCTTCHTVAWIEASREPRNHWEFTVNRMRARMRTSRLPVLNADETKLVVDYLSAHFGPLGPQDPNTRLPRTLLQGKSLHYRAVQYDIADTDVGAEPHDMVVGPHGIGWASERDGKLGRLDPKTLEFSEVPVPPGPAPADGQLLGNPQINAKGELWDADAPNRRWLKYDVNTGTFTSYAWPENARGEAGGNSMLIHPNGTIWETSGNGVRMLDPVTKEFKFFDDPSVASHERAGSYGITVAGDGSVWWAEDLASRMVRIDPVTFKAEEFTIPYDGIAYPRRMDHDARGDIWVGLWNAGLLMKLDYETKKMTFFAPPTQTSGAYSVSVDRKNNLIWVSEQMADKIARFNPKTGEWVEFPLPDSESDPRRIEVDQNDPNRVWWSGASSARMGFIEVLDGN